MQSLFYEAPGRLNWRSIPDAKLESSTDALVRPTAVALCDLDFHIVQGRTPFEPPFGIGHECVARVVAVGADVREIRVGEDVIVPFQISCGACRNCFTGLTAHCQTVNVRTAGYGFGASTGDYGGVLSDLVRVPFADAMLVRTPPGVHAVDLASCSDNIADAWRTVVPYLQENPGAEVLVVGGALQSVGLYAVACALASGAGKVDYVDQNAERLELAAKLGANSIEGLPERAKPTYPITVDASGDPNGLRHAALSTAPEGHLFCASMYFVDTSLPIYPLYMRGFRFRTGRVHSRAVIPNVLEMIRSGRLRPGQVTTRVAPWTEAHDAILAGTAGKLVVVRDFDE